MQFSKALDLCTSGEIDESRTIAALFLVAQKLASK
jgi:hypothetical protein